MRGFSNKRHTHILCIYKYIDVYIYVKWLEQLEAGRIREIRSQCRKRKQFLDLRRTAPFAGRFKGKLEGTPQSISFWCLFSIGKGAAGTQRCLISTFFGQKRFPFAPKKRVPCFSMARGLWAAPLGLKRGHQGSLRRFQLILRLHRNLPTEQSPVFENMVHSRTKSVGSGCTRI